MNGDYGHLPPFRALRAFVAVARTKRFASAATELHITQSAVSHQVRQLEEYLGVRLFERGRAGATLTEPGERYYDAIVPAFEKIRKATLDLRGPAGRRRVALTTLPSVASTWLIPNWNSFEQRCPGIDLQLLTTTRIVDLRKEHVDLALRYGDGHWPGLIVHRLFSDALVPVCCPEYLTPKLASDPKLALERARLILNELDPDEWAAWSSAIGLSAPSLDGALHFADGHQVLEAAYNGLGLAIGRRPIVDSWLRAGSLIAPFGRTESLTDACYLCYPDEREIYGPVQRVAEWIHWLADQEASSAGASREER